MRNQVEISIIICTYNTKNITCKCLDNLKKSIDYLKKPVDVILIENGTDGTGNEVKKKYPWVKLIEPRENTGFAKGNNLGIKNANKNTKYYLFLNSDVLVNPETLSKSVSFMEENIECSVLGCKLKLDDGNMQPSAGYLPNPNNTTLWMLGLDKFSLEPVHPKKLVFFSNDRRVGWVMGAFLFMRNDVVTKTHGFDEKLFMYMEEVEWCKRINDAGYEIWYTPSFQIIHLDKTSSNNDIKKPLTNEIVGLKYYLSKYHPNSKLIMRFVIWLGVVIRWFVFYIIGNNYKASIYKNILKVI